MLTIGIDIGSITAKAAAIRDAKLAAHLVSATGYNTADAAERVFRRMLGAE